MTTTTPATATTEPAITPAGATGATAPVTAEGVTPLSAAGTSETSAATAEPVPGAAVKPATAGVGGLVEGSGTEFTARST